MVNAREILEKHRITWETLLSPLFLPNGEPLRGRFITIRSDTHTPLANKFLTKDYVPAQNVEIFSLFDSVIEDLGGEFVDAGEIYGGRRVWARARTSSKIMMDNKTTITNHVLLCTDHGGTGTILQGEVIPFWKDVALTTLVKPPKGQNHTSYSAGSPMLDTSTGFGLLAPLRNGKGLPLGFLQRVVEKTIGQGKYAGKALGEISNTLATFPTQDPLSLWLAICYWADFEKIIRPQWTFRHSGRVQSNWFGSSRRLKARALKTIQEAL